MREYEQTGLAATKRTARRVSSQLRKTFTPSKLRLPAVALVAVITAGALLTGCGDADDSQANGDQASEDQVAAQSTEPALVVVTTGIWADVVENLVCADDTGQGGARQGGTGQVQIVSLIPDGGDSHVFEPSLADRSLLDSAHLVVANGLDLEAGLTDTLDAVEQSGTPVFHIGDFIDPISSSLPSDSAGVSDLADSHDDHDDDDSHDHDDHDHGDHEDGHEKEDSHDHDDDHDDSHKKEDSHDHDDDDDEHGHEKEDSHNHDEHGHKPHEIDPHFWFDPNRVAMVLPALAQSLVDNAELSPDAIDDCVEQYRNELVELDTRLADQFSQIPPERRKLITNHDSFGYLANRYGLEVIGTITPAASTLVASNPAQLAELVDLILAEGVPAIFTETQRSDEVAQVLASRSGDVQVVPLYTETLGEADSGADTYVGFMTTNAQRIVDALS